MCIRDRGKPSHVFAALGLSKQELMGVLRVSFGPDSTRRDVYKRQMRYLEKKSSRRGGRK